MLKLINSHYLSLIIGILGWILGWYGLVLTTVDVNDTSRDKLGFVKPTKTQWYGIIFAIILGVVSWAQRILAIQGDTSEQG